MIAILRTNDFTRDYEIVTVLKNPYSESVELAKVKIEGEEVLTGGILCGFSTITCSVLNTLSPEEQWDWLTSIKSPNLLK